jgi:hypothetical protein
MQKPIISYPATYLLPDAVSMVGRVEDILAIIWRITTANLPEKTE